MAITAERAKVIHFAKPFEATGLVVVVSPKAPLTDASDVKAVVGYLNKADKKVVVQLGSVNEKGKKLYFPTAQTVTIQNLLDGYLQVSTGRADAYITDDVSALSYLKEHPGSCKVVLSGRKQPYLINFPAGGGVPRGQFEFCHWVDIFVQNWIDSGDYKPDLSQGYRVGAAHRFTAAAARGLLISDDGGAGRADGSLRPPARCRRTPERTAELDRDEAREPDGAHDPREQPARSTLAPVKVLRGHLVRPLARASARAHRAKRIGEDDLAAVSGPPRGAGRGGDLGGRCPPGRACFAAAGRGHGVSAVSTCSLTSPCSTTSRWRRGS